jgi:hypothetical protein
MRMPSHNADIAAVFEEIANLLEIEGANPFRIRAYRNAAQAIGALSTEVYVLLKNKEDLTELPGIGRDLAGKIEEIVATGHCALLDRLQTEPLARFDWTSQSQDGYDWQHNRHHSEAHYCRPAPYHRRGSHKARLRATEGRFFTTVQTGLRDHLNSFFNYGAGHMLAVEVQELPVASAAPVLCMLRNYWGISKYELVVTAFRIVTRGRRAQPAVHGRAAWFCSISRLSGSLRNLSSTMDYWEYKPT